MKAETAAEEVLRFWFEETRPEAWWASDPGFDRAIAERFGGLLDRATAGELSAWRRTAHAPNRRRLHRRI